MHGKIHQVFKRDTAISVQSGVENLNVFRVTFYFIGSYSASENDKRMDL